MEIDGSTIQGFEPFKVNNSRCYIDKYTIQRFEFSRYRIAYIQIKRLNSTLVWIEVQSLEFQGIESLQLCIFQDSEQCKVCNSIF